MAYGCRKKVFTPLDWDYLWKQFLEIQVDCMNPSTLQQRLNFKRVLIKKGAF